MHWLSRAWHSDNHKKGAIFSVPASCRHTLLQPPKNNRGHRAGDLGVVEAEACHGEVSVAVQAIPVGRV